MKSRKTVQFSERLNNRWAGYAAAAGADNKFNVRELLTRAVPGAITVGFLGGANVALADSIVYTPANITINPVPVRTVSGGHYYGQYRGSLGIDLNHDGVNDLNLVQSSHLNLDFDIRTLRLQSGSVMPGQLSKGAVIGPGRTFVRGPLLMAYGFTNFYPICSHTCSGPTFRYGGSWRNVDGFMGIQFQINGAPHFGWAEFDVTWPPRHGASATLEGYAYDTVAGQSLLAGQTTSTPETGTLGLLALGSLGLGFWRRRQAQPEPVENGR